MGNPERPPKIAKSVRIHIADLKKQGKEEEAQITRKDALRKIWNIKLKSDLEERGKTLDDLKPEALSALDDWFRIRYGYQIGDISRETFDKERESFNEKYDKVLDSEILIKSLTTITKLTERS